MVDICLLGCGGMVPLPDRWLASMMYRHEGKMILIDCGEGTQVALKEAGWGFKAIEAICFTHWHADHVAGLPGFLLTLGNSGRTEPLTLVGPPGLEDVVRGLMVVAADVPFPIYLAELSGDEPETMNLGDVRIRSIPLDHWGPCLGYSLEIRRTRKFCPDRAKALGIPTSLWHKLQIGEPVEFEGVEYHPYQVLGSERRGLKVCYCVDTRPVEGMADFVRDADLLVAEGMYGEDLMHDKAVEKKHMLFSEAAALAKAGGVKELWLTHFSPALMNPEEYVGVARDIFENTVVGHDGMKTSLRYED